MTKLNYTQIEEDFEELKKKFYQPNNYTPDTLVSYVKSFLVKHDILKRSMTQSHCPKCKHKFKIKII